MIASRNETGTGRKVRLIARKDARNVKPSLSSDVRDKLHDALNCWHGKVKQGTAYERVPPYFDACWEWYGKLSADNQGLVLTLADVVGSSHKDAAESMAASLPAAPRCPL